MTAHAPEPSFGGVTILLFDDFVGAGEDRVSPLRTDSLPLVSKIYWRESADNAIIDAP